MHKELLHNKKSGFTLVEIILAIALLSLAVSVIVTAFINSGNAQEISGLRSRAIMKTEEGLEVMHNLRDASFANLVDGAWGLTTVTNQWATVAGSDTDGTFTRTITVSSLNSTTKDLVSRVAYTGKNPGNVSLESYLSNITLLQSASLVINKSAGAIGGVGKTDLTGITLQNTGPASITIDKVLLTWTNASASITQTVINTTTLWTGTQPSGSTLDITNVAIASGVTIPVTRFRFSVNMLVPANTFNITFIMLDGSTKSIAYP